jgi:hypothetical protein
MSLVIAGKIPLFERDIERFEEEARQRRIPLFDYMRRMRVKEYLDDHFFTYYRDSLDDDRDYVESIKALITRFCKDEDGKPLGPDFFSKYPSDPFDIDIIAMNKFYDGSSYLKTGYLSTPGLEWIKEFDKELYDYLIIRNHKYHADTIFNRVAGSIGGILNSLNSYPFISCADDDLFEYLEKNIKKLHDYLTSQDLEQLKRETIIRKKQEQAELSAKGCVVPREEVEDFMKENNLSGDLVMDPDGLIEPWEKIENAMKRSGLSKEDIIELFISNGSSYNSKREYHYFTSPFMEELKNKKTNRVEEWGYGVMTQESLGENLNQ